MNEFYLSLFCYWIHAREDIRARRVMGYPPPWTNDPILQKYHFCNVRREDDRTTKEIRKIVREYKVDYWNLPYVYTLARMLNKARSLEILLQEGERGWQTLKNLRDKGATVFHTAYVVSTCGKSMDKLDYVKRVAEDVKARVISTRTLADAFDDLRNVDGLGSFLAGQVVADLKNHLYLVDAPDWAMWSSMGPGSKKGLEILFGCSITERTYEHYMDVLDRSLPKDIKDMNIHRQDLQNCLCEFSKYVRYREDRKGRRRIYA